MYKVGTPAPAHIKAIKSNAGPCRFVVYDSPTEMIHAALARGLASPETVRQTIEGDERMVDASDRMLARFESLDIASKRRAYADDVCGGVPNVPAFIAGHPLNMRRRITHREASAPIALVMELTGSSGTASGFDERGAAYLSLARLLTTRRPVELYLSCTFNTANGNGMGAIFFRVPTEPLHVSAAAFQLCAREFLMSACNLTCAVAGTRQGWSWGEPALERLNPEITYAPALPHVTEMVVFPAMHLFDAYSREPEAWVRAQFARLSGDADDAS